MVSLDWELIKAATIFPQRWIPRLDCARELRRKALVIQVTAAPG